MVASDLDVIMGAGHSLYDGSGDTVEEADKRDCKYVGGEETFVEVRSAGGFNGFDFIGAKEEFEALAAEVNVPERVLGVARSGSALGN